MSEKKFENEVGFHCEREVGDFLCKAMSTKAGYYKPQPIGIVSLPLCSFVTFVVSGIRDTQREAIGQPAPPRR